MPKKQTRLNLDSSGKQIPPKEKSKASPIYIMEKVGWQVVNRPVRIGFIFPWRGLTIFLGTILLAEIIFFSFSMRNSTGTVVTDNTMKEEEKAVALHPEKEITPITIPSSLENERDPFSSCSFKESARRAELASKKKSFHYSSILKERSYSVRIGEVIEGYKLLFQKGDTLVISKGSNFFSLPLSYRKKKKS